MTRKVASGAARSLDVLTRRTAQRIFARFRIPRGRVRLCARPRRRTLQDRRAGELDVPGPDRRPSEEGALRRDGGPGTRRSSGNSDQHGHCRAGRDGHGLDHRHDRAPRVVSGLARRGSELEPNAHHHARSGGRQRNELHSGADAQSDLVGHPAHHRRRLGPARRVDVDHDDANGDSDVPSHDSPSRHLHECAPLHPSSHHDDDRPPGDRLLLSPLRRHRVRSDLRCIDGGRRRRGKLGRDRCDARNVGCERVCEQQRRELFRGIDGAE